MELPRYRCHKTVRALKIKQVICHAPGPDGKWPEGVTYQGGHMIFDDAPNGTPRATVPFSPEWETKHNPLPGKYYVLYEDGYQSISPAEAFESGYALTEDSNGSELVHLMEHAICQVEALETQAHELGEIRATLIINFGKDRPNNTHGFFVDENTSTLQMLVDVLNRVRK